MGRLRIDISVGNGPSTKPRVSLSCPAERDGPSEHTVGNWLGDEYYQGLATEKQSSLEQLHQATNWGLSLITTAVLVSIARAAFPDHASVVLLSITLVAGWHYTIRALKGYANVMRFRLIQSGIIDFKLGHLSLDEAQRRVETYHRDWHLPITRRELLTKGGVELGFGFLLVVNLLALVYAIVHLPHPATSIAATAGATVAIVIETLLFVASPYMRAVPHPAAQRVR